jgi:hypothetical protein
MSTNQQKNWFTTLLWGSSFNKRVKSIYLDESKSDYVFAPEAYVRDIMMLFSSIKRGYFLFNTVDLISYFNSKALLHSHLISQPEQ